MPRFFLLAILLFSPLSSLASTTIPYEFDSGHASADGGFSWNWGYNIGYWDDTIHVQINIALHHDNLSEFYFNNSRLGWDPRDTWKNGIESFWSVTDASRFGAPIDFEINWVDDDSKHLDVNIHTVTYTQTYRSDLNDWEYNANKSYDAYGMDYEEYARRMTAHEIGHQIGLYDEYEGGATNNYHPERINSGGLMSTLIGDNVDTRGEQLADGSYKLDYYYTNIIAWYQNKVVPVPESSSSALLILGMGGCLFVRKRTASFSL